jgi:hypothetical protein
MDTKQVAPPPEQISHGQVIYSGNYKYYCAIFDQVIQKYHTDE